MTILDNAKHERFAQELAQGKSADEAYVLAGYKRNDGNAARLKGNERVASRVAELQSRVAAGIVITRQRILEELAKIAFADLGHEHVKTNDKRAAAVDIAKIEGWVIEKRESGSPGEFERLDAQQLREAIAERLGLAEPRLPPPRGVGKQGGLRSQLN